MAFSTISHVKRGSASGIPSHLILDAKSSVHLYVQFALRMDARVLYVDLSQFPCSALIASSGTTADQQPEEKSCKARQCRYEQPICGSRCKSMPQSCIHALDISKTSKTRKGKFVITSQVPNFFSRNAVCTCGIERALAKTARGPPVGN